MFERLYFHEGFVYLNFRYCVCFEQEGLKLQNISKQHSETPEAATGGVL